MLVVLHVAVRVLISIHKLKRPAKDAEVPADVEVLRFESQWNEAMLMHTACKINQASAAM